MVGDDDECRYSQTGAVLRGGVGDMLVKGGAEVGVSSADPGSG